MKPDHLLTETATITARSPSGARDSYGNVTLTAISRTADCYHEQNTADENTVGGDIREETWTLYVPTGDPLTSTDSVSVNGQSFEVIGQPWQTWNPRTSANGHVRATLRRTDG